MSLSSPSPIMKLRMLRAQFKAQYKGHRREIVALTCHSYRAALTIRDKRRSRDEFFDLIGVKASKKIRSQCNVVREVLVYAMSGEKSVKKRKLAWKRARAVEYLHKAGTALSDLDEEIVRRGGIEKLVREASKNQPLRAVKQAPSIDVVKRPMQAALEKHRDRLPLSNDQRTLLLLSIDMSDLDQLRERAPGTQAKLTVTRLGTSRALAEVKRVRIIK
ncbi:hypothetical protein ACVME8_001543 [Bradyrhizobium diazoefficiens]